MSGPWEKYQKQQGPWSKYSAGESAMPEKAEADESLPPLPGKTLKGFVKNLGSSTLRLSENMSDAFFYPEETIKNVGSLALGLGEKLIPGKQKHEGNVDALAKMYVDRYGGIENIKNTAYNDPVGLLADFATVAGGLGAAAKGAQIAARTGNLGRTAGTLGKLSKLSNAIAAKTDPVNLASNTIKSAVPRSLMRNQAERMYESALKPSLSEKNIPKIAGQIKTGLSESMPISRSGSKKISRAIADLRKQVSSKISEKGGTIDTVEVAKRLNEKKGDFAEQALPMADLKKLGAAEREWLNRYAIKDKKGKVVGYKQIPMEEAQKIKQGTYARTGKKYGELSSAQIEANKAIARGIKEELENAIPELKSLNTKEGALIELRKQINRAVARQKNWEILSTGLHGSLGGIGAGLATGSWEAGVATSAMLGLLRNPNVKSRLATAIYTAAKNNPTKYGKLTPLTAVSRVDAYVDLLQKYKNSLPEQGAKLPGQRE